VVRPRPVVCCSGRVVVVPRCLPRLSRLAPCLVVPVVPSRVFRFRRRALVPVVLPVPRGSPPRPAVIDAPRFHPASSCSGRRFGVLFWWWSLWSPLAVSPRRSRPMAPCFHLTSRCSWRRLRVPSWGVRCSRRRPVSRYSSPVVCRPLVRRAGRPLVPLVPLFPLFPSVPLCPPTTHIGPLSTPRAIARGSGWGCFVDRVSSPPIPPPPSRLVSSPLSRFPLVVAVSSLHANPRTTLRADARRRGAGVVAVFVSPSFRLPHIHPASRCSQRWWW
jgi:hypothetical protein